MQRMFIVSCFLFFAFALLTETIVPDNSRKVEDGCVGSIGETLDFCPFPQNLPVKDVALGALAVQSTTYKSGGDAYLAIDGNREQQFWGGKSCSHTAEHKVEGETVPWLRIDLGGHHLVKEVRLFSRADDCCADRYHDIQVRVGDHKEGGLNNVFSKNGLCNQIVGGGYPNAYIFNFTCVPCLAGRYVSVQIVRNCTKCQLPHYNILSVCELEIYGYPVL